MHKTEVRNEILTQIKGYNSVLIMKTCPSIYNDQKENFQ